MDTIGLGAEWTDLPKRTLNQLYDVLQKRAECRENHPILLEPAAKPNRIVGTGACFVY